MSDTTIRCTDKTSEDGEPRTRTLSVRDFAEEILRYAEDGFRGAPSGPIVVEYLGPDGRVHWQAHHRKYSGLVWLARELLDEAGERPSA